MRLARLIAVLLLAAIMTSAYAQPMRLKGVPTKMPELPTLYVNTTDGKSPTKRSTTYQTETGLRQYIVDNPYKGAWLTVKMADSTLYDSGLYTDSTGCRIKIRGNTSAYLASFPPYKIKLQKKADPLDFGYKEKGWILLRCGPIGQRTNTLLDEIVARTVALSCGMEWEPNYRIVNLVLNGSFRGFYILCDPVEKDKHRMNIEKGGFIIENDPYWFGESLWFDTDYGHTNQSLDCRYTFKYPDPDDISTDSVSRVQRYMNEVEHALFEATGRENDLLDIPSFAHALLAHDILGTWDVAGSNIFFYRTDSTSRLKRGPLWDFDTMCTIDNAWTNYHVFDDAFDKQLLRHREFVDSYIDRWYEIRDSLLPRITAAMDTIWTRYGEAIQESEPHDVTWTNFPRQNIAKEIPEKTEWFQRRLAWIDEHIQSLYSGVTLCQDTFPLGARLLAAYDSVAAQALDRTLYDSVMTVHRGAILHATDYAVCKSRIVSVRNVLLATIRELNTATGFYDLTPLLSEQRIIAEETGEWEDWSMTEGFFQLTDTTNVLHRESTETLPAGQYTLRLQATRSAEGTARIFLGKDSVEMRLPEESGQYATANGADFGASLRGRGWPLYDAIIQQAFQRGLFWNTVRTQLTKDAQLTFGIHFTPHTDVNILATDHLQLFYGPMPDAVIAIQGKAGDMLPLCLPMDVTTDDLGELFSPLGMEDGRMMIYPLSRVPAGEPFLVRLSKDVDSLHIPFHRHTIYPGDAYPLKWGEPAMLRVDERHSWALVDADGKAKDARTLTYVQPDWQHLHFNLHIENLAANRYLQDTHYEPLGTSQVSKYLGEAPVRKDWPGMIFIPLPASLAGRKADVHCWRESNISATLHQQPEPLIRQESDGIYVLNVLPNEKYAFTVRIEGRDVIAGECLTHGTKRMIWADLLSNVRDLGGIATTDGRTLRYGHLYRGSALRRDLTWYDNAARALRQEGIGAELDLRRDGDRQAGTSDLGLDEESDAYFYANTYDHLPTDLEKPDAWMRLADEFRFILSNLQRGRSVYIHCSAGADRTGLLVILLEGVLGATYDELCKDYEISTLSYIGLRTKARLDAMLSAIGASDNTNIRPACEAYFTGKMGITPEEINLFRTIMLTDEDMETTIPQPHTTAPSSTRSYNLGGIPVPPSYRGIIITEGRKSIGETKSLERE